MARTRQRTRYVVLAGTLAAGMWVLAGLWPARPSISAAERTSDLRNGERRSALSSGASTRSSPIAITSDDRFVWSVNPDNDSVSVFLVESDANRKLAEIPVGEEPWCVAVTPETAGRGDDHDGDDHGADDHRRDDHGDDHGDDHRADDHGDDHNGGDGAQGSKVYVTNMVSGTVSVIDPEKRTVVRTIRVGTEPFGCALTPDGERLYVANQSSATISVIDTTDDRVIRTIGDVGTKPHGLALTEDGTKLYVTQFLSESPGPAESRPLTQSEGSDNGRVGRVTVIDTLSNTVVRTAILDPVVDTGFRSDGSTLGREPVSATPVFDNTTGAFPNLLESVFIRGSRAYVPGTCSSPNGPFRFNVNVQSCLSTIDTVQDIEAFGPGTTLNMNAGVQFEPVGTRLFNTNPFAVAFKRSAPEGFVALGATDRLVRVTLDPGGRPTINPPAAAGDPGAIVRIPLKDPQEIAQPDPQDLIGGKNPRGLVLNSRDTRAYVMDFISRDVAVVDVAGTNPAAYKTIVRMPSAPLPPAGSVEAIEHRGKHLFNSAIGPEGAQDSSKRPAGRLSDTGWGTCYSCHVNGLTDSVTWMFADGPRQAISMESTFTFGDAVIANGAPVLPASHQRALNWSAVRDEVQDFTRNIRAVSGGGGLIAGIPEGAAGLAMVPDLVPVANTGRSADLDAIATYLARGVRAPISPLSSTSAGVPQGRALFAAANCQSCHGGPNWTTSILDYTPPPAAAEISDAQLVRFLRSVGTFDPSLFSDGVSNEIRANNVANVQARGVLGFNIPSLISVFASAPYLHNGSAPTLDKVLENVTHRSAGTGGVDTLTNAGDRRAVVRFLQSIDRRTEPF